MSTTTPTVTLNTVRPPMCILNVVDSTAPDVIAFAVKLHVYMIVTSAYAGDEYQGSEYSEQQFYQLTYVDDVGPQGT